MSRAGRSVFVFGIYLLFLGASLIIDPNGVVSFFGVPKTSEVWIRVLGVVLVYVGTYYLVSGRYEYRAIFWTSVPVRLSLVVFLSAFVALGYVKGIVILFGVADVAGALWTLLELRRGGRRSRSLSVT